MPGTLGQPIQGDLNIQAGGNPYSGLASGGLAGLGQAYAQDYNSYLSLNKQNYDNILRGYGTVMNNIGSTLGQGGTAWGIAQPAADEINARSRASAGGAIQNSINSGVGKSTAAVAAQRGVEMDREKALGQLGSSLAGTYAGYEANLGQSQLGFMNSVNAPPPNAAAYTGLAQQYGIQQQQSAQLAMQGQALQAQQQAARMAASRSMASSGGRGVSIGAAPRGGTYGSGGGGFPSGGGVGLSDYGIVNPNRSGGGPNFGGGSGAGYGGGIDNVGVGTPGDVSGYDPWATNTGTASGNPAGFDPSGVTGNFGNQGYWLGSGVA